jgi:poly(A) polymerase
MTEVKRISVPKPLSSLGESFKEAGHELYLVGGIVRSALLDGPDEDAHPGEVTGLDATADALSRKITRVNADATTDAYPNKIKRLLRPYAEHLWTVGERFGTIGARVGEYDVEVTTYRSDLYTEGSRHPEVRFGESLEEDLARRDFTINAVAADALTGEILDPFDGRKDLELGIIRAVGNPLDRMRDDPLRMLRAVRFETVLSTTEKPFGLESELERAIKENAHWLESISAERIREEFEKILTSENVAQGLRTLVRLGLMP